MDYYIGIDVGTGSARVGIFNQAGNLIADNKKNIHMWKLQANFVEQSSEDIWAAICDCSKKLLKQAGIEADQIKGIGFDATCSLVLIDKEGQPVTVDPDGDDQKNVIVWMDHRALEETDAINQKSDEHSVFEYVGGKISPEMQTPKLLWLKKRLPESWQRTAHFFDLPDYLTYRATGELTRSLCSTTCKWTHLAHEAANGGDGWQAEFFKAIDLGDFVEDGYARIGTKIRPMGEPIGNGLSREAAEALGLTEGTPVGVSIIDAHAGGIGMIGLAEGDESVQLDRRLALIGGTSSCHMAVSPDKRPIPGVWGPYYSSMVPGLWLNEGGQSATGALIDHVIFNHGAMEIASKASAEAGIEIFEFLKNHLSALAGDSSLDQLTESLHMCPYFHGNRSPRANPHLKGMISGLMLSATIDDLALQYLATIQAIAYGTRHIIEEMNKAGYEIDTLICCGGGAKNPVFLQQHANATGCRIILPEEPEAVLLGSSMLGAVASGDFKTLQHAMKAMSRPKRVIMPEFESKEYHHRKYRVFHKLYEDQLSYDFLMQS